jgi:hypothetical protein
MRQRYARHHQRLEMLAILVADIGAAQCKAPVEIEVRGIPLMRRRVEHAVLAATGPVVQQIGVVRLGAVAHRIELAGKHRHPARQQAESSTGKQLQSDGWTPILGAQRHDDSGADSADEPLQFMVKEPLRRALQVVPSCLVNPNA